MKVAVTYAGGEIFQHFGHTEQFKIYEIEDKRVVSTTILSTEGKGHSALANLLADNGVDILICGGIGGGAQMALLQAGVRLFGGVSGNADEAVNTYLAGRLVYNPNARCTNHEDGHTCGNHDCH